MIVEMGGDKNSMASLEFGRENERCIPLYLLLSPCLLVCMVGMRGLTHGQRNQSQKIDKHGQNGRLDGGTWNVTVPGTPGA